ncbi:MAG TPA: hypothetical protein VN231_02570 [Allosphingosinicella sp.]|nr:hypothetical protein [Allosphingosinicella sp.]
MPGGAIRAAVLGVALFAWAPARAQNPAQRTELEEALGRPKTAPVVPAELRAMVRTAERDRLVVRGLNGADIEVDISEKEPERFAGFGGGRFFGFSFLGYEHFGFILVDRAAEAAEAVIATGEAPAFSSDGRYFAAAQITEGGFGNLEAVAVWEVLPGRSVRRFLTDSLPRAFDWRVDGWPRPDCAAVSAIDIAWEPPDGVDHAEAMRSAPRSQYQIEIDGEGVMLRSSVASAVCGVVPAE